MPAACRSRAKTVPERAHKPMCSQSGPPFLRCEVWPEDPAALVQQVSAAMHLSCQAWGRQFMNDLGIMPEVLQARQQRQAKRAAEHLRRHIDHGLLPDSEPASVDLVPFQVSEKARAFLLSRAL